MIRCTFWEFTGRMSEYTNGVSHSILKNVETGEETTQLPVGAMWYCSEDSQQYYTPGPDGKTLFVKTPGGDWNIDSRASNCGLPEDDKHRCWVRHGTPPNITVDKNGLTCKAGAGSIQMREYHGYLRNGCLVLS